jgi:hypothetical protein
LVKASFWNVIQNQKVLQRVMSKRREEAAVERRKRLLKLYSMTFVKRGKDDNSSNNK